ncbi:CHD3-type chromatin-remodeling factor PICKLE [Monoraphidium neglectum]|uniref:CHD3-type chromatin-remodeling factor PICKLE n=1 Tax=Monoraphidium neglectum TaxID=145388 RepID=A0A0D2LMX3_9CHLO|nr:CHD3-type chromatin-remodeling factor PICKLE [Monoraphidium neglectum]KIY91391.1 CHD3-type chromatin-remodeling factor PICKLE [Monoraphidium neglectum]|eukprot:XP_013890411.1 CHD3-type chromatin-remodeling factor PICKLE [Monoraphidium neglectum]
MGQKNAVMTYRLVTRGTVEERMMQRAKEKMVMEHLVVSKLKKGGARESRLEQSTLDDILRWAAGG